MSTPVLKSDTDRKQRETEHQRHDIGELLAVARRRQQKRQRRQQQDRRAEQRRQIGREVIADEGRGQQTTAQVRGRAR